MYFNLFMRTSSHPLRADKSAVGAINRPLRRSRLFCSMLLSRPKAHKRVVSSLLEHKLNSPYSRPMLLTLFVNYYRESHACLIVPAHLAGYLVFPCGWECEITSPCCTRHDGFKLNQHLLILLIGREWSLIWLIGHNHELVKVVSAIRYDEVIGYSGMKDRYRGVDPKFDKRDIDFD